MRRRSVWSIAGFFSHVPSNNGPYSVVKAKDENGWTPLHEGARSGKLAIVKFLIESGADVNATTGKTSKDGGTALWWAKQSLEQDNPVIAFLESIGAMETGPEL